MQPLQNTLTTHPLTAWRSLYFIGSDAQAFLQGQLSNDIRALSDSTRSQYHAYCNPKGRMLANFIAQALPKEIAPEGGYQLLVHASLADSILKRLKMYIMRSKVSVHAPDVRLIGICGHAAFERITDFATHLSPEKIQLNTHTTTSDGTPRMIVSVCAHEYEAVMTKLASITEPSTEGAWNIQDIEAGLITLCAETAEAFVPQMVNYDLIDGINFKKGCYPGQEIVARTKYLGKIKKRMYLLTIPAELGTPNLGDKLYSEDMQDQACGEIAQLSHLENGNHLVLAVVYCQSMALGVHYPTLNSLPVLRAQAFPYTIPEDATTTEDPEAK